METLEDMFLTGFCLLSVNKHVDKHFYELKLLVTYNMYSF